MAFSGIATGLQHIGGPTNDIEKTISFYVSLGFKVAHRAVNGEELVAFLRLGDLTIETYQNFKAVGQNGAVDHIAINVTDVDEARRIADGMGLTGKEAYLDPRYQEAADKAKKEVAFPGTSEHQLGLAVDLMDKNYSYKPRYEDMNQDMFAWLDAHCAEYGFIKRYPTRKLLLTGWDEPWHYRYVGVEAATFIMEHGICYEEFYAHYHPGFEY